MGKVKGIDKYKLPVIQVALAVKDSIGTIGYHTVITMCVTGWVLDLWR